VLFLAVWFGLLRFGGDDSLASLDSPAGSVRFCAVCAITTGTQVNTVSKGDLGHRGACSSGTYSGRYKGIAAKRMRSEGNEAWVLGTQENRLGEPS
jgi:hypothetical protein